MIPIFQYMMFPSARLLFYDHSAHGAYKSIAVARGKLLLVECGNELFPFLGARHEIQQYEQRRHPSRYRVFHAVSVAMIAENNPRSPPLVTRFLPYEFRYAEANNAARRPPPEPLHPRCYARQE